jgi:DNA-binding transcriptional ArsR family regulator
MSQTTAVSADLKMAKAMSHPIRVRALEILNRRVASPSDIARELEMPVANVSYHVNTLRRLGCIEEVSTRAVRGAIEHMYRAVRRPFLYREDWEQLSPEERENVMAEFLGAAMSDLRGAMNDGDLELRTDRHLSFTRLRLDEQGWDRVTARLAEVLDEAMMLEAECATRIANGQEGGDEVPCRLTMCFYERSAPGAPAPVQSSDG